MAFFKCLIRGENFPLVFNGVRAPTGFFATRVVEAISSDEVERKAIALLKQSPELQLPPGTPGMENSRVYFEHIEEVPKAETNTAFEFFRG